MHGSTLPTIFPNVFLITVKVEKSMVEGGQYLQKLIDIPLHLMVTLEYLTYGRAINYLTFQMRVGSQRWMLPVGCVCVYTPNKQWMKMWSMHMHNHHHMIHSNRQNQLVSVPPYYCFIGQSSKSQHK
jgi:hypothetical protein